MNTEIYTPSKMQLQMLIKRCTETGPQLIHNETEDLILLSKTQYDQLTGIKPDYADFLNPTPITDFDWMEYQYY